MFPYTKVLIFSQSGVLEGNIRKGVDGFAFEGIDGAGVFLGVLEPGVSEKRGDGFDVGSVVEQVDCE